ncbi:MAG: LD-carboxypeptidase [Flavobacteriaceae bacterium]|nr:LD-carboxypeptidase [Flavobacteriaceae bacterium]
MYYFCGMIRPNFLQKGDTITLLSPAGSIRAEQVLPSVELLKSWGLNVKISAHSFAEHHRFAGTDEERISDLQSALDDKNTKAILCNRGGYGSLRLLEKLDFTTFLKYPKWLIGFSDITIFHSYFNSKLQCETLHAPMPVNLSQQDCPQETVQFFKKALLGEKLTYEICSNPQNKLGIAEGELIGGNLATLFTLLATDFAYKMHNKILFLEDIGEPIHKIDQMLLAMKLSGCFTQLKGLLIGGFTDISNEPKFGKTLQELIAEHTSSYNFPIVYDFPVGHIDYNYPLFVGRKAKLEVGKEKVILDFC